MKNTRIYPTPVGKIGISEENQKITEMFFADVEGSSANQGEETPILKEAAKQLQEYFEGQRKEFDLPLEIVRTDFQKRVWQALRRIPYGKTCSYKDIAIAVNSPKGFRAVGMANHENRIPIVIPCHRVIGANGKMVGFSSGIGYKEKLLDLEKQYK